MSGTDPAPNGHDKIGIAIDAAKAEDQMITVTTKLASGKPLVLVVPQTMDDFDALCIQRAVLDLRDQIQQAREASKPHIAIARGVLPKPPRG